jgi:ribonuclease HIII
MATLKTKVSGKEYAMAQKAISNLLGFLPKSEQYVATRMDGQDPKGKSVVIKLYNNGTLMLQSGSDAALAWAVAQLPASLKLVTTNGGNQSAKSTQTQVYPHIGTDESGKGDYFGPLVVCGVTLPDAETAASLKAQGVRDGKTVTDKNIGQLSEIIKTTLPPECIAFWIREPDSYNAAIEKANAHGQKLNHVLACGHGTVISELVANTPTTKLAIVDQFAQNTSLVSRAATHAGCPATVTIQQETKAESHIAVAAASILARHEFLTILARLSDEIGMALPKGAGSPVNQAAKRIARELGEETLKSVCKWHFKTTQSVLG